MLAEQLEAQPESILRWLNAVWTLTSRKGDGALAVHQSVIEEKLAGETIADLVDAHSRAVGRLSRAIAAELEKLR